MKKTALDIALQALKDIAAGRGMYGVDGNEDAEWAMWTAQRAGGAIEQLNEQAEVEAQTAEVLGAVSVMEHATKASTWEDDWRPPQPLDWQEMPLTNNGLEAGDRYHRYTIVLEKNGFVLRRSRHPHGLSTVLNTAKDIGELERYADDLRTEESKP